MRRFLLILGMLASLSGLWTVGLLAPTPASAAALYTATARVSNAHPERREPVTVMGTLKSAGRPVAGATMTATWYYRSSVGYCTVLTDRAGVARCTREIGAVPLGYRVRVVLTFRRGNVALGSVVTYFTPQANKGRG